MGSYCAQGHVSSLALDADSHCLRYAVANNLTVVRMFAFAVVNGVNLQLTPGEYNETLFQAFDYVVDKAGQFGLKLIPVLANNWEYNTNMTDTK